MDPNNQKITVAEIKHLKMYFYFQFCAIRPKSESLNASLWWAEPCSGFYLLEHSEAVSMETSSAAAQALKYLKGDLT